MLGPAGFCASALARGCDSLVIATSSRGYASPHCKKAEAWADLGLGMTSVLLSKRVVPAGTTLPIAHLHELDEAR